MSWAAQVEWMDEKEFAHFQKELVRDPTKGPLSRGTKDLLAVLGTQGAPQKRKAG